MAAYGVRSFELTYAIGGATLELHNASVLNVCASAVPVCQVTNPPQSAYGMTDAC